MKSTLGLTDTDDPQIEREAPAAEPAIVNDPHQRTIALVGAILMTIGVFLPIVRLPIYGSTNYFQNGTGDGVIILFLAGLSFLLFAKREYSPLVITGGLSLAVLSFTLFGLINRISGMRANVGRELEGNMFRGIGEAMVTAVQIEWGWLPLFGGAVLLVVSGWKTRTPWRASWSGYSAPVRWSIIVITAAVVLIAAIFAITVLQVEGLGGLSDLPFSRTR